MTHLDTTWEALREAYGVSLWVLVAGLVGLAVLAAASLSKRVREAYPWSPLMVAFLAGALAGIRWDMHEYDAWPDLFPLLPLGAVGVGALVKVLMGRLPLRAGVAVTLVAALAATGLAFSEARDNRNDLLEVQRQSVDAVLGRLPSDATIISLEAPQPLVLARKTNPERHQMFGSGLTGYIADTWPGGMDGFRDWVVDHSPTVIVEGDPMPEIWRKAIEPDYVYVGCAPDFFWYVQRSLGERKIEELREAARIEYSGAYGMRDGPCPPPG